MVSGDTKAEPILAYSNERNFKVAEMPANVAFWMDEMKSHVENLRSMNNVANPSIEEWSAMLYGQDKNSADTILLRTALWDQGTPYNAYTPDNMPTGCVATAMSIIMHFHKWPDAGQGTLPTYSYELADGTKKTIKGYDLGYPYQWDIMPYELDAYEIDTERTRAIARLMSDCGVMASNSLDEYIIRDTLRQGAKIDLFGVGERLITSKSNPVFGGVYKLVAVEKNGEIIPKIKKSENVAKITTPCAKKVYRLFDNATGKAIADVITLIDEEIDDSKPYELFDPNYTWKRKVVENYTAKPLLVRIFDKGECCYDCPDIKEIKKYCDEQINNTLWDEVKRFENPHTYYVDLSEKLWAEKNRLLDEYSRKTH